MDDCINPEKSICENCLKAQEKSGIDIKRFLLKLTEIKQTYYYEYSQELSPNETTYLCLLLHGYTKQQIAYYFYRHKIPDWRELEACKDIDRRKNYLNSEMSKRIHKYIKDFMGLTGDNQRVPHYTQIIKFLKAHGYGIPKSNTSDKNNVTYKLIITGEFKSIEEYVNLGKKLGLNINLED